MYKVLEGFRNLYKVLFQVANHTINKNFGFLIAPIFGDADVLYYLATGDQITNEQTHMERFRYEFFVVNIGSAAFKGSGASLKKKKYRRNIFRNSL